MEIRLRVKLTRSEHWKRKNSKILRILGADDWVVSVLDKSRRHRDAKTEDILNDSITSLMMESQIKAFLMWYALSGASLRNKIDACNAAFSMIVVVSFSRYSPRMSKRTSYRSSSSSLQNRVRGSSHAGC